MEELLNNLIEKGWKPRGKTWIDERDWFVYMNKWQCIRLHKWIQANNMLCWEYNLRELVSKESWLWQFVCEDRLVKKEWEYRAKRRHLHWWEHDEDVYHDISYTKNDYEYYIIESTLKDESELEEFLLDNIKIEW